MKKKVYIKPVTETVRIIERESILAASGPSSITGGVNGNDDYAIHGPVEAPQRPHSLWDSDEE